MESDSDIQTIYQQYHEEAKINSIRFETFKMGPFEGFNNMILSREAIFVRTIIDERPFLEIAEEYERSHVLGDLRGKYEYQYADELYRYFTDKQYRDYVGVGLLICGGCLCEGCWPFFCEMTENGGKVIWSKFYNPHLNGEWGGEPDVDYGELGPFEFDKKSFWSEVEKLKMDAEEEHRRRWAK
jgi:hypothetical protein